ncbi:hypothetical protein [Actinoplanes solisilvae]|uniref:hypothetical protein n=1 Tax=Actinoplanes solisilvae TaxID=2486853 RepID=UPI00196B268C|nr:hypothetical protein [Actinoplanes solisilvae]
MRSQMLAARAAALFVSDLPAGSRPSVALVETAIAAAVRTRGGTRGCVAELAAAYGDYPETAVVRMRWARSVVLSVYDRSSVLSPVSTPASTPVALALAA